MKLDRIANRIISKIDIPKDTVIKFDKGLFDASIVALKNRNFKDGLSTLNDGLQSIINMMHKLSKYSDNEMNKARRGRNIRKDIDEAALALTKASEIINRIKDNLGEV